MQLSNLWDDAENMFPNFEPLEAREKKSFVSKNNHKNKTWQHNHGECGKRKKCIENEEDNSFLALLVLEIANRPTETLEMKFT